MSLSNEHTPDGLSSLIQDGYWVARDVLQDSTVANLIESSRGVLAGVTPEHRSRNRSQGSLINLSDYHAFADIIAHPAIVSMLRALKFADPVFSSGYLISKPPQSPALFWHQDWWGWDDPISYTDSVTQVFVMIYLTNTSHKNGCLRVLPGSHRRRHALHEQSAAHAAELSAVTHPDDPIFGSVAGERAIEVAVGDVVVGDARLLHGAYPNTADEERMLLTLWYHPDFRTLPEGMRARICDIFNRRDVDTDPDEAQTTIITDWPTDRLALLDGLLPCYTGNEPPHAWNRQPDVAQMRVG